MAGYIVNEYKFSGTHYVTKAIFLLYTIFKSDNDYKTTNLCFEIGLFIMHKDNFIIELYQ